MKTLFTIAAITATILAQASGTFSMIEINPLHGTEQFSWVDSGKNVYGAGELSGFVELNDQLFFSARNEFDNDELWSTNATQGGTTLVKDINPTGSSQIGNMVKVGNRLLFMATDNGTDFDLWTSNGTPNGTQKVAELNQFANTSLNAQNISVMGSRLLFCTQTQLMITDGTTAGTDSLLAITSYSQGFGYCELNNKVYFLLPSNIGQQEIWRTDGTEAGTELVTNATTALNIVSVSEMIAYNGKIYLNASVSGQGSDLFSFDGNVNGQLQKIEIAVGGNSYPTNFVLHDNAFFFSASGMTSANIYRITTANAIPQEVITNASFSWLNNITFANNSIYFLTDNQQQIHRVDLTSLNHSVTQLDGYSMPYYSFTPTEMLVGAGGKVFMALYDSINSKQVLFEANEALTEMNLLMPISANTIHPFNFVLGCGTADIFDFKMWGSNLILPANFNDAGRELWIFKADDLASRVVKMKNENSFAVFPNPTKGMLNIQTNNNGYCDQQINIVNVNGEIVLKKNLSTATTSIQLSSLASGNYFAMLFENGKAIATKKLVLTK